MSVPLTTLRQLREQFPGSSWALWSEEYPDEGCIEEQPDQLVEFIESNRSQLNPEVVFVSLNPSSDLPTDYANFHSPSWKHYDERIKEFVQENELENLTGGYMTDIVPDVADPNSANVTPDTADIDRFSTQLSILDKSEYHVICFTGKTFEALKSNFGAEVQQHQHNIESFTESLEEKTLHVYRVWFYGLYGVHQQKVGELEKQLKYLNDEVIESAE
ncbi:hypothetical protein HWV23_04040 [Natronomonas halophila]|uniref:hypothetical protein n=1 Tax=Natronomonas halophila TaxID=2747817 RepID=UPI0015B41AF7|nr:hypothetical protein [Natronomonas halophila]QLD84922.1 hypothetical protein HWV23_04040 [Natronomonas halophila]